MKKFLIFSLIFVFLVTQAAAITWTWENHSTITHWLVQVTEDESDCGGSTTVKTVPVTILHTKDIADISDFGHGKMTGSYKDDILTMQPRTIKDGQGNSKLSKIALKFTPDCLRFSGRYSWDYIDSSGTCSGVTTLRADRTDSKSCPESKQPSEADESTTADPEKKYKDILAKDPTNFWANWDMAELKKNEKKYDEYLKYVDAATKNENIFKETGEKLKQRAATSLHLSEFPSPTSSPILRYEMDELDDWPGGYVNNVLVPKEQVNNKEAWYRKWWAIKKEKAYQIIRDLASAENKNE